MLIEPPEELTKEMFEFDKKQRKRVLKKDVPEEVRKKYEKWLKDREEMRKRVGFKPKIKKRGSDGKR